MIYGIQFSKKFEKFDLKEYFSSFWVISGCPGALGGARGQVDLISKFQEISIFGPLGAPQGLSWLLGQVWVTGDSPYEIILKIWKIVIVDFWNGEWTAIAFP